MPSKNKRKSSGAFFKKVGLTLIIILLCLILLAIVFFVLNENGINLIGFGGHSYYTGPFPIEDRCSFIAGQLIHTIKSNEDCSLKCRSECYTLGSSYDSGVFSVVNETSCNTCQCTCN